MPTRCGPFDGDADNFAVLDANLLLAEGVRARIGTNNLLNGFTPFGDASILRIANLYLHVAQVSTDTHMAERFEMITSGAAAVLNHADYGIRVGNPADVLVRDTDSQV